ncbi:minor tail protein [Microbacterium phage Sparcetus]|nr:minor tail protein [Microbacterium phage Sparcetus]
MGGGVMPSISPRPEDILVEIRDKNLVRQGAIPAADLDLKFQPVFNGVGSWSLTLPAEHPKVPLLRQPGNGIIVTNHITGQVEMSGSISKPSKKSTASDTKGMVTVAGLDDNRLLWDAQAYPQPSNADVKTQNVTNDVRTASAEGLIRAYAAFNICNGALAGVSWAPAGRLAGLRNYLRVEPVNKNLGLVLTKRPRFQNLGDLLREIAVEGGGLGFRVVQIGSVLELQVYQPSDLRGEVRLDVANGTLQEQVVETSPPEVTRVIVAGQGEGLARQFVQVGSAEATAAEAMWGFVIEEFKDQRNTGVMDELLSSGKGIIEERGFTKVAIKAVPANDQTMVFMQDFFLGDRINVVIDGKETASNITEAVVVVNRSGLQTAVAIGDIMDFDRDSALRSAVADNTRRIEAIEANVETSPDIPAKVNAHEAILTGRLGPNTMPVAGDANLAVEAGTYWLGNGSGNSPDSVSNYALEVVALSNGSIYQEARRFGAGIYAFDHYTRSRNSGVWSAWKALGLATKTFSPTIKAGLTLGNGTLTGSYSLSDGFVSITITLIFGSTTAMTGDLQFDLPPFTLAGGGTRTAGSSRQIDTSAGRGYPGIVLVNANTVFARTQVVPGAASGALFVFEGFTAASNPFPWASGDSIVLNFDYPTN